MPRDAGAYEGPGVFPRVRARAGLPTTDDLAAAFLDKLKVLAGFGLASHTRLLLETPRRDG